MTDYRGFSEGRFEMHEGYAYIYMQRLEGQPQQAIRTPARGESREELRYRLVDWLSHNDLPHRNELDPIHCI